MRVFVAGATGVIGVRLIPLLLDAGHVVAGLTRTPAKGDALRALGAESVVCDVYEADRLRRAVVAFGPQAVIHQLTDLPDDRTLVPERTHANARIRREGTRNLIAAADAAGASRLLAQSVAWKLSGDAGDAVADLETAVLSRGGIVLRYGQFYGPGTYHQSVPPPVPRVHVDEAARRTVLALDAAPGITEIVDPG